MFSKPANSKKNIVTDVREVEFMYRCLVQHSPDAIILHHNDQFLYVNPAAVKLFGAADERDLMSRSIMDFIPNDDQQRVTEVVAMLQNKVIHVQPMSFEIRRLDGTIIDVDVTATSVCLDGRQIIQGMIRDVTHQRVLQEVENVNHEWKILKMLIGHLADKTLNPLAVIEGFLTLLKEGSEEVSIDLLLREATSIRRVWNKVISVSREADFNDVEKSPLDVLPNK